MTDESEASSTNYVELAVDLTAAWLENSHTRASVDDVPVFLRTIHAALAELSCTPGDHGTATNEPIYEPAVSIRKSLGSRDSIVSMIDGKPYRTLRRHLATHGLTPDQYRERYGLKLDYPMTAPSYSEARSAMAKERGLGRKPAADAPAEQRRGRGRPKKST